MLSVKQRQYNLKYNGFYYTGQIDGEEGPLMRKATGLFQRDTALEADRKWGPLTDSMSIAKAKGLQRLLNAHGANLKVDGIIGALTIQAIKNYQRSHGLIVDGIAGTKTLALLKATTWDSIKYFKRSEFKCPCGKCNGYPVEIDMRLVKLLDELRAYFGVPITITSGIRCDSYNKSVGGIKNSEHLKGKAADIYVPGVSREKVKSKALSLGAKYSYHSTPGMGNAVHINI